MSTRRPGLSAVRILSTEHEPLGASETSIVVWMTERTRPSGLDWLSSEA
jgi:hypothetical protein